jgi:hypothetical protein
MIFDRQMHNLYRQLLGLPAVDPDKDPRPMIDFGDEKSLLREDLTREERIALKSSTFMIRYGGRPSFPDWEEMRELSLTDAKAMVKQFNQTYSCAGLFKRSMETVGPTVTLDHLDLLYPDPDETPEERHERRKRMKTETLRQIYGGTLRFSPGPGVDEGERAHAEQVLSDMVTTGRKTGVPELQFTPPPVPGEWTGEQLEQWGDDLTKAIAKAFGVTAPETKSLVEADYAKLEQRIMAQTQNDAVQDREQDEAILTAMNPPGTLAKSLEQLQTAANNFKAMTEQAGALTGQLDELKNRLRLLQQEHNLTITGLDDGGEQINISFPEGMSQGQQMEIAQKLGNAVTGKQHEEAEQPVPEPVQFALHASRGEPDLQPRIAQLMSPGRNRGGALLAGALASGIGGAPVLPGGSAPTSSWGRGLAAVDRTSGEIGRVSPDLAYKLKQAGYKVEAGDMLKWFPLDRQDFNGEMLPQVLSIGAFSPPNHMIGPIPLNQLPHKVQKRAALAKP